MACGTDCLHGQAAFINRQYAASVARSRLENMCLLNIESQPSEIRLTGIVCTIGKIKLQFINFTT